MLARLSVNTLKQLRSTLQLVQFNKRKLLLSVSNIWSTLSSFLYYVTKQMLLAAKILGSSSIAYLFYTAYLRTKLLLNGNYIKIKSLAILL